MNNTRIIRIKQYGIFTLHGKHSKIFNLDSIMIKVRYNLVITYNTIQFNLIGINISFTRTYLPICFNKLVITYRYLF